MRINRIAALAGGVAMALAIGGIANAGMAGVQRQYLYEAYPQYLTEPQIVEALEQASIKDMQDARDGNKNGPEFMERSVEANDLAVRLEDGYPVTVAQVDDALAPVHVW
jgi:hypothetical protein